MGKRLFVASEVQTVVMLVVLTARVKKSSLLEM